MIGMSPDAASFVADKTVIHVAIYIKHSISTPWTSPVLYIIRWKWFQVELHMLIIPKKLRGHELGLLGKRYTSFFHTSPPLPFTVSKTWWAPWNDYALPWSNSQLFVHKTLPSQNQISGWNDLCWRLTPGYPGYSGYFLLYAFRERKEEVAKYRKMMTRSRTDIGQSIEQSNDCDGSTTCTNEGRNEANCIWIFGFRRQRIRF
jgi:hypothetical protein